MKALKLIVGICFISLGCKKSNHYNPPPPQYPHNEFKATLSVDGASPFVINSVGNSTLFSSRTELNGDKVFVALGSGNNSQIMITLVNITAKGTYSFFSGNGTPGSYAFCDYVVGSSFAPTALYSTLFGGLGTMTIDSLSSSYISGSFSATCIANGNKITQITSGSFKGNF